jgi:NAD+ synthase
MTFDEDLLEIDPEREADRIAAALVRTVRKDFRRRGAVVGVSGGVDSAVVLALCARGLGAGRVIALLMPERESSPESRELAMQAAAKFGVAAAEEDITPALDAFGCYRRRDEAIRRVIPEYDPSRGYRAKISLPPNVLDGDALNVFSVTVVRPDGSEISKTLPPLEYLQIVAASNLKQRARMSMLYYHAELNHYAVAGTANKNEHDLGFFVKYGDGGVDLQPIVHLYKTQVYDLAEYLGVPEGIRRRIPTTDTYSAPSTQEEFFFRLPFHLLDRLWSGMEARIPRAEIAAALGLTEEQVERVSRDLERKESGTGYLRMRPVEFPGGAKAGAA